MGGKSCRGEGQFQNARMTKRPRDPTMKFPQDPRGTVFFLLQAIPHLACMRTCMQLCCLYIQNNQYNMNAHYLVSLPTSYTKIKIGWMEYLIREKIQK